VNPVSWTFPSTHSVWQFGFRAPPSASTPAGEPGRGTPGALGLPEARSAKVYAFTSAAARVLLIPSVKSRGAKPRLGENAPSPPSPVAGLRTSQRPWLTA